MDFTKREMDLSKAFDSSSMSAGATGGADHSKTLSAFDGSAGAGGSSSSYPDMHLVFDFFSDNPQKVVSTPGDGTTASTLCKETPFYDHYWESIRAMQESPLFIEGMLLRSLDCKRKSLDTPKASA